MKIEKLQKRLEKSKDKLRIFANKRIIDKYELSEIELYNMIEKYLTDEQKVKLFEFKHFRNYKKSIIKLIKNDNLKVKLLEDDELLSDMDANEIFNIVKSLTDYGKMQIIQNQYLREKLNTYRCYLEKIIISLTDENKIRLLSNEYFIENELKLQKDDIKEIISSIGNERKRLGFMDDYKFQNNQIVDILSNCSDEYKESVLLEKRYDFEKSHIAKILISMDINKTINFLNEYKQFCIQNGISPNFIVGKMDSKKQLEFISKIEDLEEETR